MPLSHDGFYKPINRPAYSVLCVGIKDKLFFVLVSPSCVFFFILYSSSFHRRKSVAEAALVSNSISIIRGLDRSIKVPMIINGNKRL